MLEKEISELRNINLSVINKLLQYEQNVLEMPNDNTDIARTLLYVANKNIESVIKNFEHINYSLKDYVE